MERSMREPIAARVRLLLALLLSLGIGACADGGVSDPGAGGSRPTLDQGDDDCDDDDDHDEDDDEDDDDGGDLGDDDDGPHFLCEAEEAPSLAQSKVSFYAVRGEARSGSIWYHARPGAADSTELVRLDLGPTSLLAHPGGTPVAPGDSVLITIEVKDQERGIVWFQPDGLAFSPSEPARMTFAYGEADDDVNGDGMVDDDDEALEAGFAIWRQESETEPFTPLPSQLDQPAEQVAADIEGFTRYAVAY
jgi:hypothetical protein